MKKYGLCRISRILCGCIVLIAGLVIGILYIHHVPQTITAQDEIYIEKIIDEYVQANQIDRQALLYNDDFDHQITLIRHIQHAAYQTTPIQAKIPLGHPREPKDLYEFTHAQCSDRARFMHKALRRYGFETRYISLYETPENTTKIGALLSDIGPSHALIEVKTSKGWMMVGSVQKWIALDDQNTPISIKRWSAIPPSQRPEFKWKTFIGDEPPYPLMMKRFTYVIGLYSRNGKLYPPYTPFIPDINWPELIQSDTRDGA